MVVAAPGQLGLWCLWVLSVARLDIVEQFFELLFSPAVLPPPVGLLLWLFEGCRDYFIPVVEGCSGYFVPVVFTLRLEYIVLEA